MNLSKRVQKRIRRPGRGRMAPLDIAVRALFVVLLVAAWQYLHYQLVTVHELWSKALFPSPVQVGQWLWDGFGLSYLTGSYQPPPGLPMPHSLWAAMRQADYPTAMLLSLSRLIEGYVISVAIGFPLGLLVARSWLADRTIGWLANSLQGLPSICWIPLAILWFGHNGALGPILFVTIMGSLFATVIAVADGVRNVPPLLSRAGQTLGARGARLYFTVLLPSALPSIVTGLKIGWSFAWRSLMAAELIVNSGGLGFLLERDRSYGDADGVLSTIFIIIVLGLGIQMLVFAPLERRLRLLWGLGAAHS